MDILNKSLNKGIPSVITFNIPYIDIIEISTNKTRTEEILTSGLKKYLEAVSCYTKRSYRYLGFNRMLQVNTDDETFEKYITVSDQLLSQMLVGQLNIDHIVEKLATEEFQNPDIYTNELALERLNRLRKIKTESQLKKEFPYLYQSYEEFTNMKAHAEIQKKLSPYAYFAFLKEKNYNKYDIELLENVKTFPDFIKYVSESFQILIDEKEQLSSLAEETKIDSRVFGFRTSEKLELYIAHLYMKAALSNSTDKETKQKISYFLSAYMFENAEQLDDDVVLKCPNINYNGEKKDTITKRDVYEGFKRLLITTPELFNVNFDYHIFTDMSQTEIDNLMREYLETLKLKWDIIPSGEELPIPKEILETQAKEKQNQTTQQRKQLTKEQIEELFYQKKSFFDSSEPLLRVMGKDTFNGYIGYIYPNGTVILDKYYEDAKKEKLATSVAIYSMNIDDFYRLSSLSKTEIIRDRLCKRFYHRGDWQNRVQKEITGTPDSDIYQKTKILKGLSEYNKK